MLADFVLLTSAFTGALGVVAAARGGIQRIRFRRVRTRLLEHLRRLQRLDGRLCALVVDLQDRLAAGVEWAGSGQWPRELGGRLTYLDGMIDELDRSEAVLRALEAVGSTERLRADVERMVVVLRRASHFYFGGSLRLYESRRAASMSFGCAATEVTPLLGDRDAALVRPLRDEFTSLMRTTFYRLNAETTAERYRALWPIGGWELERARQLDVWRHEPAPIDW